MKPIFVLLMSFATWLIAASSAIAVTIIDGDRISPGHVEFNVPGYLIAGRVSIATEDDWQTVWVRYSLRQHVADLTHELYIDVPNASLVSANPDASEQFAPSNYTYFQCCGPDRRGMIQTFTTRWAVDDGHDFFDDGDGFRLGIEQWIFGNEDMVSAGAIIDMRQITSIEFEVWDYQAIAAVPLPAAGWVLLLGLTGLRVLRRGVA